MSAAPDALGPDPVGVTTADPRGWSDLAAELDRWASAGRVATLWWRDDDAVAPSRPLDRLLALAGTTPLALAVIPAAAEPALAERLAAAPGLSVLQHGWRHVDHAAAGEKKAELAAGRAPAAMLEELAAGRRRLRTLFGERFLPVLTPPWNRLAPALSAALPGIGLVGLSTIAPRRAAEAAPGLTQINVHVDLVAWHEGRGFIGTRRALALLTGHLAARRLGRADAAEPTGILTHHLVQDAATEAFLARLLDATLCHGAARWVEAADIFPAAARRAA